MQECVLHHLLSSRIRRRRSSCSYSGHGDLIPETLSPQRLSTFTASQVGSARRMCSSARLNHGSAADSSRYHASWTSEPGGSKLELQRGVSSWSLPWGNPAVRPCTSTEIGNNTSHGVGSLLTKGVRERKVRSSNMPCFPTHLSCSLRCNCMQLYQSRVPCTYPAIARHLLLRI